jgi:hypothetical protein
VPTDAFDGLKDSKAINYLKLRVGYGTSAGFPTPYNTRIGLASGTRVFLDPSDASVVNVMGVDSQLGNLNLKPELHRELEFGLEGTFFDRRVTVDFSIYDKKSFDLLYNRNLDPSTGYTSTLDNISEISNKGVELALTGKILRPKTDTGFAWDITATWSQNINIVEDLGDGVDQAAFAGFTNLGNFAVPGRPYGVIYGSAIARDANGNKIVDYNGSYLATDDIQEIGDPNALWRSTLINEFSYKNLSFQFQMEYTHGGDMYSTTASALMSRGLTKDTDFDRSQTFVLPGVNPNGNVNTIQIPAAQWGFENNGFVIDEQAIYDASTIRLREISLSYNFPKKVIDRTPFGKISLSFIGNNLWFNAFNTPKYVNFDPEVSSLGVGNGQGFDYLTGPTAKRYGFNLNLTF